MSVYRQGLVPFSRSHPVPLSCAKGSAVKTQEAVAAQRHTAGSAILVNSGVLPNTRGGPLETISLCQTKALAVFKLDVDVEGNRVQAVVDTAAEATLISDRLFYTLNPPPPFIRPCKIATAGRELSMDGGVVGPVRLKLGDRECTENIYVTPLEDEMLIGFDLLTKYGANIDMGRRTITFQDGSVDSGVEMARSPGMRRGCLSLLRATLGWEPVARDSQFPVFALQGAIGAPSSVPPVVGAVRVSPIPTEVAAVDINPRGRSPSRCGESIPCKRHISGRDER